MLNFHPNTARIPDILCKYIFYTRKKASFDKRKETYIWLLHDTLTCVMRYFGWYFLIKMVITSICFAIIFRMMVSFLHDKCLSKRIAYNSYKNCNLPCLVIFYTHYFVIKMLRLIICTFYLMKVFG